MSLASIPIARKSGSFWASLSLDRSRPEHLQAQLYDQIRDGILQGRILPGAQMPASRLLAAEVGCSRNTVVEVVARLVGEGYLVSVRGSGVYVEQNIPDAHVIASALDPEFAAATSVAAGPAPEFSARGAAIAATRLAVRGDPHVAFMPSMPDVSLFPIATWTQLNKQAWQEYGASFVYDTDARGFAPLREAIAAYVCDARNVPCEPEQVIVTAGAQQGIDFATRLLLDPGDRAWVEDPGYPAVRGLFRAAGAAVVPVPVDDAGIVVDPERFGVPRAIAVSPSNQFPTGSMMSVHRRLELLAYAERVGAWIVEDDYDSEFRYEGHPVAALAGMSESSRERVIYVGTFSKMLFPAIRLGFLVVPKRLAQNFARARRIVDFQPSIAAQPALARFITEGHLAAHVRRMRLVYRQRRQVLLDEIESQAAHLLACGSSRAGMQLVARFTPELARRCDDVRASRALGERGVNAQPLSMYYAGPTSASGFVLGYACAGDAELKVAMTTLVSTLGALPHT